MTPQVLELLAKHNAHATFFAIGVYAEENKELIQQMIRAGHTVLTHSIDHGYSHYFKGQEASEIWIQNSISHLNQITGLKLKAFRPPAGILNPPIIKAALVLKVPLILWSHRFFDTVFQLTPKKIENTFPKIISGDIILLHDRQKLKNRTQFLLSLELLMVKLKEAHFQIAALTEADIASAQPFKN